MKSQKNLKKKVKSDSLSTELAEKVVVINRVAKVVKGGRRFSFSALSIVGDEQGHVGIGFGKANEVPDAIRKSVDSAKKNVYAVKLNKKTIPHEVIGVYKSSKVILKPATPGTGIIAGATVRAVVEKAGVHDILAKCLGSRNPVNVVKATLDGLLQLRSLKESADVREVPLNKVWEA